MEEPIFQSIGQALHIAFLMDILPVTQKSPMQVAIDRMKEDAGILQERKTSQTATFRICGIQRSLVAIIGNYRRAVDGKTRR